VLREHPLAVLDDLGGDDEHLRAAGTLDLEQ